MAAVRFRETVTLIATEEGTDKDGYSQPIETETEVYADVQSVKRSEFYIGRQAGLALAAAFLVRTCDYDGQPLVEYDGKRYRVERTYTKDGELVELNCSEERRMNA